jgi:membrane protein DedA with SNARE-associated domain
MFGHEVLQYVQQYGDVAIFALLMFGIIGLPFPDETMLTFSGYLIYKGHLPFFETYIVAWVGAMSGITSSYLLGRFVGYGLLLRYGRYFHITQDKLDRVERWFQRGGKWLLTAGYFIPGVRHLTAVVAGSSKLPFHTFALFAYAGGLIWTATFLTIGYVFGEAWQKVAHQGDIIIYAACGVAALAIAALFVAHRYIRKARNASRD